MRRPQASGISRRICRKSSSPHQAIARGRDRRKRNADSFVDAINAEDVGKLPDANLAEVMKSPPCV